MYYIEISDNRIIGKGYTEKNIELDKNFLEITESQYNYIRFPSTFELDENGNVSNIQNKFLPIEELSIKVDKMIEILMRLENSMLGLEGKIETGFIKDTNIS